MRKHNVIYETGSTYRIALSSEEDLASATGNMCKKIREVWTNIQRQWSQYFARLQGDMAMEFVFITFLLQIIVQYYFSCCLLRFQFIKFILSLVL